MVVLKQVARVLLVAVDAATMSLSELDDASQIVAALLPPPAVVAGAQLQHPSLYRHSGHCSDE